MDKNIQSIEFPISLSHIQQTFLDYLLNHDEFGSKNIISNLLSSEIEKQNILLDVILPSLNTVNELYNRGKIGETEKLSIYTLSLDIVTYIKYIVNDDERKKTMVYSLTIVGSEDSVPLGKITSVILYLMGWNSSYLGNVEYKIDPFFDIDLQRFISRQFSDKKGIFVIIIFSFDENTLRFILSTISSLKSKFQSDLKIAIFTSKEIDSSHLLGTDNISTNLLTLLEWIKNEFHKIV